MYCKKCGKFVEGESDLCENCRQAPTYAQTTVIPPQPVNNGFKKALASTIVSEGGGMLMVIGLFFCNFSEFILTVLGILGILFLSAALAAYILGLIWGIQSIKKFAELKRAGFQKPVATLVLGIVGVAIVAYLLGTSAFSWIFTMLVFPNGIYS